MTMCEKPPTGWRCTRGANHDGPCAAIPEEVRQSYRRLKGDLLTALGHTKTWDITVIPEAQIQREIRGLVAAYRELRGTLEYMASYGVDAAKDVLSRSSQRGLSSGLPAPEGEETK